MNDTDRWRIRQFRRIRTAFHFGPLLHAEKFGNHLADFSDLAKWEIK
jgi:hypothetical protein